MRNNSLFHDNESLGAILDRTEGLIEEARLAAKDEGSKRIALVMLNETLKLYETVLLNTDSLAVQDPVLIEQCRSQVKVLKEYIGEQLRTG